MNNDFYSGIYNPDVLSCLANLSNDEVFTPPEVANSMLDMLPQELFSDPNTKFLDPACKSGVFLREIAKRLLTGLEPILPDLQQRIANPTPRFTAVVVFPTPPFWLHIAMVLQFGISLFLLLCRFHKCF